MVVARRLLGTGAWLVFAPIALFWSGSLAAQAGPAQTPAAKTAVSSEPGAGEIVVTAQRREQSLQKVPISVAVASGDMLRRNQITDLNDLGNRLSGVKVNKGGPSDGLNIRGIGSGFNQGFEQSVATFIDGVYISRSQATRAGFLDLERIEVLKGPQSTYFGSNAIAGALSVVTRKPTQNLNGYASALYSPSDGEYDLQTAVGGPIAGKLSGRVAVRASGMNGYIYNYRLDTKGPRNRDLQGRVALRYQTPGALDVNLRVDYTRLNDKHAEFQEFLNCPPAAGYGAPGLGCRQVIAAGNADNRLDWKTSTADSSVKLNSVNAALTAALTLGSHTLTSTSGYYHHSIKRFIGSPLQSAPGLIGITDSNGLPLTGPEKFDSFSQELRLQSEKGKFIDYMVGAYYDNSHLRAGTGYGFYFAPFGARLGGLVNPLTPIAQFVSGDQHQYNRSLFAAATLNFTPALRLTLGARYSSIRKTNHRSSIVGAGDNLGQFDASNQFSSAVVQAFARAGGFAAGDYLITSRTDKKFMPSVNLQYDVAPRVMLYASYSTGFKAGGWAIGNGLDSFGPETVKYYEAGAKAGWFNNRLTTNVAVYDGEYKDLQQSATIYTAVGVPVSIIGNVGKARTRGVDFELTARPLRGLSLTANVGYLDAKYLVYPNAPCTQLQLVTRPTGCTQDLSGSRKAYAPTWSGSVSSEYAFDVTPNLKAKLNGWVYFSSGFYQQASIDPLLYQPRYAKLDLRAAISNTTDRWEVAVIAKNVTNKATASYRSTLTASNAVTALTERPRSFAVQLSTKF